MIGIFDSGAGGLISFYEVRRLLPREDIVYLADRKNAPYGTKTKDELKILVKRNIEKLRRLGAHRILIACCSASTVFPELSEQERKISLPIIRPAARLAARGGGRITVIATERTVLSRAFSNEIGAFSKDTRVLEIPMQCLVSLVESGARDNRLTKEQALAVDGICDRIRKTAPDTLILGCTHFSHLEEEFARRLPRVKIISPAKMGAYEFVKEYRENYRHPKECGRTVYT